ncbi:hypothetical protein, partial [Halomonas sp. AOP35-4E-18]|uniref:hypothetical protein n=1 Tax=Halomonas sp. AOP35-4E-18 TaxID=3457686 RepID=UPI004034709A
TINSYPICTLALGIRRWIASQLNLNSHAFTMMSSRTSMQFSRANIRQVWATPLATKALVHLLLARFCSVGEAETKNRRLIYIVRF